MKEKKEKRHRRRGSSEQSYEESRKDRREKHKEKYSDRHPKHHHRRREKQESHQHGHQRHDDRQFKRDEKPVQKQNSDIPQHGENQEVKKQEPNFQPSGILLEFYNSKNGVSLKFHEPPEASHPDCDWRIYPFKDDQPLQPILLKQSCYLVGKDDRVCDILCENSSISRQHAVIQFRKKHILLGNGEYRETIKPYIMDLESTNGTLLNGQKIEGSKYYQLIGKDVVKFGLSQREYVFVEAKIQ